MGLISQLRDALETISTPSKRLDDSRIDENIEFIDGLITHYNEEETGSFEINGSKQFIIRKPAHSYYRNRTQLRFWGDSRFHDTSSFYVEDPITNTMAPIVKLRSVRGCSNSVLVWIGSTTCEPVQMNVYEMLYVSNEPYVAGMTLKELEESYA